MFGAGQWAFSGAVSRLLGLGRRWCISRRVPLEVRELAGPSLAAISDTELCD